MSLKQLPPPKTTSSLPSSPAIQSTVPTAVIFRQKKTQKQMDEETAQDKAAEDYIIKMVLQQMLAENPVSSKVADSAHAVLTRPPSPNSFANKPLPRNPLGSKILKWKSDQKTHVLTLLRSNGVVKHISREQALGLGVEDLQDLLELTLCRDEEDSSSKDFEAEFKRQAKELLMR